MVTLPIVVVNAMNNTVIRPKPLTQAAFARFGDVIETEHCAQQFPINTGYTQRFHDLATLDIAANGGRPLINIFRSTPLSTPIVLAVMERHPLSSQAFYPLSNNPYLVAVAPKGTFDVTAVEVFLVSPSQGVNYHPGTWHHFCLALQQTSDFLVIDRGGQGSNCDEVYLADNQQITVSLP